MKGGIMGVDCFLRIAGLSMASETTGTGISESKCDGEVLGECSGVWVEWVVVVECLTGG
jgi:hypothetical protein